MKTLLLNHKQKKGFTLIELMISVAIVGILSAVAVPAYQNYIVKAQVSEGMSLSGGAKIFINDYYTQYGKLPQTSEEAGLPSTVGSYIASLSIQEEKIVVTFKNTSHQELMGKSLKIEPVATNKNNLTFECSSDEIPKKYLPANCH